MKVFAFSDSHLGHTSGNRITPDGTNVRQSDFFNTFLICVDRIIGEQPDVVVHAGDLFNSIRPSNKVIEFAIREFQRILDNTDATILVIGGNHEKPKMNTVTHVFDIMKLSLDVRSEHGIVVNGEFSDERVLFVHEAPLSVTINTNIFHLLPYRLTTQEMIADLATIKSEYGDANIMVAHGTLPMEGIPLSIDALPPTEFIALSKKMDIVLLGHNHNPSDDTINNIFTLGSIDRGGWDEHTDKYTYSFDTINLRRGQLIPTKYLLEIRDMHDMVHIAIGEDVGQITNGVLAMPTHPGAIVRLTIEDIEPKIYQGLDRKIIREHFSECTQFRLVTRKSQNLELGQINSDAINVLQDWQTFAQSYGPEIISDGAQRLHTAMPTGGEE